MKVGAPGLSRQVMPKGEFLWVLVIAMVGGMASTGCSWFAFGLVWLIGTIGSHIVHIVCATQPKLGVT